MASRLTYDYRLDPPAAGSRAHHPEQPVMPKRNIFYAQSGGVTSVINASACGVIETARKHRRRIGKVYAGRNGIIGALREDLIDTSRESAAAIRGLASTPAGAFGSCRHKLRSLEENRAEYERLIEVFRAHDIGYFFYNGGGDSADTCLKVSQLSATLGYPLQAIHVPKTIDNDLSQTAATFGFDTAVSFATECIERLHTTAASHRRVIVVEVMGRYAGWIAMNAGVSSDAHVVLIPEIPFDIEKVTAKCLERSHKGKGFTIIAAGEGARPVGGDRFVDRVDRTSPDPIRLGGVAKFVSDRVHELTGLDSRHIVLGHVQRGGTPTPYDRVLATQFGHHAFELLTRGVMNRLVVMKNGRIDSAPIESVADKVRTVPLDSPLIAAARAVGTSFGD